MCGIPRRIKSNLECTITVQNQHPVIMPTDNKCIILYHGVILRTLENDILLQFKLCSYVSTTSVLGSCFNASLGFTNVLCSAYYRSSCPWSQLRYFNTLGIPVVTSNEDEENDLLSYFTLRSVSPLSIFVSCVSFLSFNRVLKTLLDGCVQALNREHRIMILQFEHLGISIVAHEVVSPAWFEVNVNESASAHESLEGGFNVHKQAHK